MDENLTGFGSKVEHVGFPVEAVSKVNAYKVNPEIALAPTTKAVVS